MSRFYNERAKELKDKKIADTLRKLADDYENGEIIEVQDTLIDIVNDIEEFIKDNDY